MRFCIALNTIVVAICITIGGCDSTPVESRAPSFSARDARQAKPDHSADARGDKSSKKLPEWGEGPPDSPEFERVSDAVNDFGFRLHREFDDSQNLVYSPYCIYEGLALTHLGAVGATAEESAELLGASNFGHFHGEVHALRQDLLRSGTGRERDADENRDSLLLWRHNKADSFRSRHMPIIKAVQARSPTELRIVNDLWFDRGLDPYPAFIREAERYYEAIPTRVDFQANPGDASRKINEKVADATDRLIPRIIDEQSIGPNTRLVQTTAVYFRAPWRREFAEGATHEEPFYLADGTSVTVDMMNSLRESRYAVLDELRVKALRLSYRSNGLDAVIVLPNEGDLKTVEESLDAAAFRRITEALDEPYLDRSYEVHIKLPKFEIDRRYELTKQLEQLGLQSTHRPQGANLSGIADTEVPLYISANVHAAHITVNEKETEAAAGFGRVGGLGSTVIPERVEFHADRPFLFFVVERSTATILYTARVMDPTAM
jgi:serpin B